MPDKLIQTLASQSSIAERQRAVDEACEKKGGCTLRALSLSGFELSGLRLINLRIEGVDLSDAKCHGVVFPELSDCILDRIDASGASFPRLNRCMIRHALLNTTEIGGRIAECDFSQSSLRSARIGPLLAHRTQEFHDNRFDGADLHGLDAAGAYLAKASFKNACLREAKLSRAVLSECDLQDADLSGSNLTRASFRDAIISGAKFVACVLTAEQATALRNASSQSMSEIQIISPAAGPNTIALAAQLEMIGEYHIDWRVRIRGDERNEKLMITNKTATTGPCGYAFQGETSEFIRMYPLEEHGNVTSILMDMAADYANWMVDPQSITVRVTVTNGDTATRVGELVRRMSNELFNSN